MVWVILYKALDIGTDKVCRKSKAYSVDDKIRAIERMKKTVLNLRSLMNLLYFQVHIIGLEERYSKTFI